VDTTDPDSFLGDLSRKVLDTETDKIEEKERRLALRERELKAEHGAEKSELEWDRDRTKLEDEIEKSGDDWIEAETSKRWESVKERQRVIERVNKVLAERWDKIRKDLTDQLADGKVSIDGVAEKVKDFVKEIWENRGTILGVVLGSAASTAAASTIFGPEAAPVGAIVGATASIIGSLIGHGLNAAHHAAVKAVQEGFDELHPALQKEVLGTSILAMQTRKEVREEVTKEWKEKKKYYGHERKVVEKKVEEPDHEKKVTEDARRIARLAADKAGQAYGSVKRGVGNAVGGLRRQVGNAYGGIRDKLYPPPRYGPSPAPVPYGPSEQPTAKPGPAVPRYLNQTARDEL
jgi:hypothetical protein